MLYYKPDNYMYPPIKETGIQKSIPVDIVITTYKEYLNEIAGALPAAQNIRWAGPIQIFILDDAKRSDVEILCSGISSSSRTPVTRVTRDTNTNRKAGFINNVRTDADFFVLGFKMRIKFSSTAISHSTFLYTHQFLYQQ